MNYFHLLLYLLPMAMVAALPIFGVIVVNAKGLVGAHRLAIASIAIYGLAFAMPAAILGGDLTFGFLITWASFLGVLLFDGWHWGMSHESFWYPIACTMGALANISFIVGYVAYLIFVIWRTGIHLARWAATLGFGLSLLVILPLMLSTELNAVFIGHGLWISSMLALALGCRRVQQSLGLEHVK